MNHTNQNQHKARVQTVAMSELRGVLRSISHLHLRTTGQAKSVGLLGRQAALQRPPYCGKQEVDKGEKNQALSAVQTAGGLFASVRANESSSRSRDFRLTRERLLSRGCVRWLGP